MTSNFPSARISVCMSISPGPVLRSSSRLPLSGGRRLINGVDAGGRKEVISVPAPDGYVVVRGWAVDDTSEACPSGIVIELDGKPIPAVQGLPRAEIPLIIKGSQCRTGGFVWGVPAGDLGREPHELTVKVIAPDGQGWYEANRRVRFRIQ